MPDRHWTVADIMSFSMEKGTRRGNRTISISWGSGGVVVVVVVGKDCSKWHGLSLSHPLSLSLSLAWSRWVHGGRVFQSGKLERTA